MYAKVINNELIKYPYTIRDYKLENKNLSIPKNIDLAELENVVSVEPGDETDLVDYSVTASLINGKWKEVYVDNMTPDESLVYKKRRKLGFLTVTTQNGNIFNANETARNNMLSKIIAMEFNNETSVEWHMYDNQDVVITIGELKEALSLAIDAVGKIVKGEFNE